MFTHDNLQELKITFIDKFRRPTFLIMFIGVVVAPLVLFVIGGRDPNIPIQPALVWYLGAISLLLLAGIGIGYLMFGRKSNAPKE
jgi:hypothetical protein